MEIKREEMEELEGLVGREKEKRRSREKGGVVAGVGKRVYSGAWP